MHSLGEAYGARPSSILGMETPWGSWQVDQAALIVGRQFEKDISEGKQVEQKSLPADKEQYRDPRGIRTVQKVKIKADGTW